MQAEDGEDWARRATEGLRQHRPMFGVPSWMSDDQDMTDLASRMSHAPHWATLGRRGGQSGPWRERRSSGGSGGMGAYSEDDSSQYSGSSSIPPVPPDQPPHEIPIKLEREAPQPPLLGQVRKPPQFATRTSSAVEDGTEGAPTPRGTRCASAPPDVTDGRPPGQRFISKMNITPQSPQHTGSGSSVVSPINSVPKPFVPMHKQASEPIQEVEDSQQQASHNDNEYTSNPQVPHNEYDYNQHQPFYAPQGRSQGGQRPSVVRNIPIMVEERDVEDSAPQQSQGSPRQPQQPQVPPAPPQSHWEPPFFQAPWHQRNQPQSHNFKSRPFQASAPHQQSSPYQHPASQFTESHHSHQPQPQPQQQQHPQPKQQAPQQQQWSQAPPQQQQHRPEPHPQQQERAQAPQQQTQTPMQQSQPTPQQPQVQRDPKMDKISEVQKSVDEYKAEVSQYKGGKGKKDRQFLYLDEMLTRALLKLDDIDPDGRDDVRQARRALIKDINSTISTLERQTSITETPSESQDTEPKPPSRKSSECEKTEENPSISRSQSPRKSISPAKNISNCGSSNAIPSADKSRESSPQKPERKKSLTPQESVNQNVKSTKESSPVESSVSSTTQNKSEDTTQNTN